MPLMATIGSIPLPTGPQRHCCSCLRLNRRRHTQQSWWYFCTPALLLLIVAFAPSTLSQDLASRDHHNGSGICHSVDIRNTLETFKRLDGCRVVEGFVQILLFDNVNETLLSTISFPMLTEITDYLLLYRVNGLRSIGQLFPNLTVIHGYTTFYNYAFVVYEMSSLQEIALHSLTHIMNGYIRIDKNPSLCFIDSIDWELIAREKSNTEKASHFIKSIKPENECPICRDDEKQVSDKSIDKSSVCPRATNKLGSDDYDGNRRHLCWNRQYCQKTCPPLCNGACDSKGRCCAQQCLGSCSDRNQTECTVCRNLAIVDPKSWRCVDKCPAGFYEFLGRRCITKEECLKMPRPLTTHLTEHELTYKIFNNTCVLHCPTNFMSNGTTCTKCQGNCRKHCPGINVDSISMAKQLRGCTHIDGSLEIQIRGGRNVVNVLEENLGMIEEIDGYLKIVRSFPLVSLTFLKNLRKIRGNSLESQKFVFVVLDNQNLQYLWDWTNRTFEIERGRLFFHFNPKLCLQKIEELENKTKIDPPSTMMEVARNSNGDKIACNIKNLNVTINKIDPRGAVLEWNQFIMEGDPRKLLGYIVYCIEAPVQNITLFDGRDACGGDGWRVDDVAIPEEHNSKVTHALTHLKPYTQYAFYIKTYTIATELYGAQSNISYFRTLPSQPTSPQNLQVINKTSHSFTIEWKPPAEPHGNVTHYIVTGEKHQDGGADLTRNFCESGVVPKPPVPQQVTPSVPSTNDNNTCSCDQKQSKPTINEKEQSSRISFENDLHNEVYIKKKTSKRDVSGDSGKYITNTTENGRDTWQTFNFTVYGKTQLVIDRLHHFTFYDIQVEACREKEGPTDEQRTCSRTTIKTERTQLKDGADDIFRITIANKSMEMITIKWDELFDPNGMILTYTIQYKRMDIENAQPTEECITHSKFVGQGKMYSIKLNPGNYSLKVKARSLAGDGKWCPYIYFSIEESNSNLTLALAIILPLLALFIIGSLYCYRRQKLQRDSLRLIQTINPEYMPTVYVPDEWEVPRQNITLKEELGQGSFGMVYEGIYEIRGKPPIRCAVKTVNEHATNRERLEFLNEASVMKAFDTAHVVRLLGVVSQGQPTLVIMELMANGDLKSYLRSHRPDAETYDKSKQPPSLRQILQMAIEIADGMAYLSAKKFVHRDLAARNCMVSENLTVKIGDFGMTRDIYETDYYRKGTKGLLPVRWMAPESLKDGVFTSSSDVWSYGVVLWEMATLASQPYQGLSNDQVLRYVIDGGVMERPENCPDKLYTLMRCCWQRTSSSRPTFLKLCSMLLEDASPSFAQVSFYHSSAGIEARTSRPTPSPSQDDPSTPLRAAADLDENFSSLDTNSDDSDADIGSDTHNFPSITVDGRNTITSATANGFVSGCATNGAATTQC